MDVNHRLFLTHFGQLQDPRLNRKKRHSLIDMSTVTICAVIAGADGWMDIKRFGKSKETWLRTFLELPKAA